MEVWKVAPGSGLVVVAGGLWCHLYRVLPRGICFPCLHMKRGSVCKTGLFTILGKLTEGATGLPELARGQCEPPP